MRLCISRFTHTYIDNKVKETLHPTLRMTRGWLTNLALSSPSTGICEKMKQKCFDSGPEIVKQAVLHIKEGREFGLATPKDVACRSAASEIMTWLEGDGSAAFKGF